MNKTLLLLPLLAGCSPLFVVTPRDIVALAFVGVAIMAILMVILWDWIDNMKRNRRIKSKGKMK